MRTDLVIIGGGPAGLAAAIAAKEAGIDNMLILERDGRLGGILNQCIHNGFGLHTFKEELTGPEYAGRYIRKAMELGIPYRLNTMVIDLQEAAAVTEADSEREAYNCLTAAGSDIKLVTAMSREEGLYTIEAGAVILAMGCRERPRGALNIPGYRPAGIYSAGTAQRYVNMEGRMPGKEVVILGSGDIGLIMARRMTLEGAKVKLVAELMPYSGGLKRNIVQCLDDYGIPLRLQTTVVDIKGKERVEAVVIAKVDENSRPIPGTEEEIACDTLLLSCGLIPENELSDKLGLAMNPATNGPMVNESLETEAAGVFACGNVLHVHDLVDYVSEEAAQAGERAAAYLQGRLQQLRKSAENRQTCGEKEHISMDKFQESSNQPRKNSKECYKNRETAPGKISLRTGKGIRYTVPSILHVERMADKQTVRFRVDNVYRNVAIEVALDGTVISSRRKRMVAPGEMEQIILKKEELLQVPDLKEICISVTEQN